MTGPLPVIQTAHDMKAITILLCCDLTEKLNNIGDNAGAHALVTLIKTLEEVPCVGDPT